ncbi:hypothetical protein ACFPJ4_13345 [Lysinimonas soli]|uniref:Uncharacterized protein n=1 Tax=Lysinimonas soli TaxID=1074233 RepID=A0ABW0NVB1_9MICO
MDGIGLGLHAEPVDAELFEALARAHPRLGLDGLLRRPGRRARVSRPRAEAAAWGFRWPLLESHTRRWWPQGVDTRPDGSDILVVSWFAQDRRGRSTGSRLTVVDLRDARRPRFHHVLLVEAVRGDDGRVQMDPVLVHAGGLAWVGDRLYAAATFDGLVAFGLADILDTRAGGTRAGGRRPAAPFGARFVLPLSARLRATTPDAARSLRYSFVSVERGGTAARPQLVVGEFGDEARGRRIARVALAASSAPGDAAEVVEIAEPGIARMQGACLIESTWFVSASNGLRPGDLWVGNAAGWTRHPGVLPAGPEDLAASVDGSTIWSLSEWPGARWVFRIDPAGWAARR